MIAETFPSRRLFTPLSEVFRFQVRMGYNVIEDNTMVDKETSRDVRARDAVEAIRSGQSNTEIMKRFRISAQGFADLLRQLFERGLISEEDLSSRGIRFRVVKKELIAATSQIHEPPPIEEPEDFLDTVELTELLSFKEFSGKPEKKHVQPVVVKQEEEASAREPAAKKGRFPFASLFKKDR
jgi:hypothetical protein